MAAIGAACRVRAPNVVQRRVAVHGNSNVVAADSNV
jgi:hypothetical protein